MVRNVMTETQWEELYKLYGFLSKVSNQSQSRNGSTRGPNWDKSRNIKFGTIDIKTHRKRVIHSTNVVSKNQSYCSPKNHPILTLNNRQKNIENPLKNHLKKLSDNFIRIWKNPKKNYKICLIFILNFVMTMFCMEIQMEFRK
jgi:hypothetical protein